MAEGWLKSLGSKLVNAGAAYVEQVRFVNELRTLPPAEARARFAKYVQELSGEARGGLAWTLSALANNERSAEARRFVEELRAGLAGSHAARAEPAGAEPAATFQDDLDRVSGWFELPETECEAAIHAHLRPLDLAGLERFRAHAALMQSNCAQNIAAHREREGSAWGGSVEDRLAYGMARLKSGQHDPEWQRTLEALLLWERRFAAVEALTGRTIEARSVAPPSAPPAESPAAGHDDRTMVDSVGSLRALLQESLADGRVRPERGPALHRLLDKMEAALAAHKGGEIDAAEATSRVKQLYAEFAHYLADPGPASRAVGGVARFAEVDAYAGEMKIALGRELMEAASASTRDAVSGVLGDVTRFQQEAPEMEDASLARLEADLLRPAARARHELAMTRHALLARPMWESVNYLPAVNDLFYSGAADLEARLEAVAAPKQLRVCNPRRLQNHGQQRWNALNTCHVAFFDLRGAAEISALAVSNPKRARELAAAGYEMGLAFALGRPLVVLAGAAESLPFDIDLTPLLLDGDEGDGAIIAQAIDEAFYVPQRPGSEISLAMSLEFLAQLTAGHPRRRAFEGMGWLDPALARDPAGFVAAAEQVAAQLEPPGWRLLRPSWPAAYPDGETKRCFHVMPFGPDWADGVRDAARAACAERGLAYRRGDEAEEGRIIHAIWDDLCRATIVLVDLTGVNLNVMIELGMAHALGRPVMATARRDGVLVKPTHIDKMRVLPYEGPADLGELLRTRLPA